MKSEWAKDSNRYLKKRVEFLDDREEARIKTWKSLTPTQKHNCAMYIYRLKTDPERIMDYLETYRFIVTYKLNVDDMPSFITTGTPEEIYKEAYSVLGANPPKENK